MALSVPGHPNFPLFVCNEGVQSHGCRILALALPRGVAWSHLATAQPPMTCPIRISHLRSRSIGPASGPTYALGAASPSGAFVPLHPAQDPAVYLGNTERSLPPSGLLPAVAARSHWPTRAPLCSGYPPRTRKTLPGFPPFTPPPAAPLQSSRTRPTTRAFAAANVTGFTLSGRAPLMICRHPHVQTGTSAQRSPSRCPAEAAVARRLRLDEAQPRLIFFTGTSWLHALYVGRVRDIAPAQTRPNNVPRPRGESAP